MPWLNKLPQFFIKIHIVLNLSSKFNSQQRWLFKNAAKDKFKSLKDLMEQEAVKQGNVARGIATRKRNPTNNDTIEAKVK